MPTHGPLARVATVIALLGLAVLVLAGGIVIGGAGMIGVGVAAAVAAALGAGVARERPGAQRPAVAAAAVRTAAWTVGLVLVVAGVAAVAGSVVATLVAMLGALAGVGWWLVRSGRLPVAGAERTTATGRPLTAVRPTAPAAAGPSRVAGPVADLPTEVLGREWLRTTAVLAGPLDAATRQAITRRRAEILDELERRDPVGFERWLTTPGTDPAGYVHGSPRRDGVAGTDAA